MVTAESDVHVCTAFCDFSQTDYYGIIENTL